MNKVIALKTSLENNIWSQYFIEYLNNKIEESNKTYALHIQHAKMNMNKSLEGNKKRIEKGGNDKQSVLGIQKK